MTREPPEAPERSRRPRTRTVHAELVCCDDPVGRAARAVSASLFRPAAAEPQAEAPPDADLAPAVGDEADAGVATPEAPAETHPAVAPEPAAGPAPDKAHQPPEETSGLAADPPDPPADPPVSSTLPAQPVPAPAARWGPVQDGHLADPPPVGLLEEACPPLPHTVALTDHARGELPDWWD